MSTTPKHLVKIMNSEDEKENSILAKQAWGKQNEKVSINHD